ncbi:MAG: hypothetical protein AAGG68_06255 [Bacteroidota bacterium]
MTKPNIFSPLSISLIILFFLSSCNKLPTDSNENTPPLNVSNTDTTVEEDTANRESAPPLIIDIDWKKREGENSSVIEKIRQAIDDSKNALADIDTINTGELSPSSLYNLVKDMEKGIDDLIAEANEKITALEQQKNELTQANKSDQEESNSLLTNIEEMSGWNKLLLLIVSLLLVGFSLYWFILSRKHDKIDKKQKTQIISLNQELEFTRNQVAEKDQLVSNLRRQQLKLNTGNSEQIHNFNLPPLLPLSKRYFFGEVMLTAGPRKKFEDGKPQEGDFDLGEDVAGFSIRDRNAFFWVLDGTSDSARLLKKNNREYFSSRLLAQSIAWNLQSEINDSWNNFDLIKVVEIAINKTYQSLQTELTNLGNEDRQLLTETLTQRKNLYCSTTIMVGRLSLDGSAEIYRIGDSSAILHTFDGDNIDTPISQSPHNYGRQFANIGLDTQGNVELKFNTFEDLRGELFSYPNIKTIVAASDGIGNSTMMHLRQNPTYNFVEPKVRKTLASIPQKTQDDKSLCILQIQP